MATRELPSRLGGYSRGKELGRGAYGQVFACRKETGGRQFAAKAIDLKRVQLSAKPDRELQKLRREININRRLPPHPNLVRFVDSFEEANWFFFIMEFVRGGDLFSVLIRQPLGFRKRPCFREEEAAYVFRQLVEGLFFLHTHKIIHRDLKLENVLVVREETDFTNVLYDVKISDFGLSKVVGEGMSEALSTVGSPRYVAPEVLANGVHDFRADLWSLGILLYVLCMGCFPTDGHVQPPQAHFDAAVNDVVCVSKEARAVLVGLLQKDRENRLGLQDLRQHPWLIGDAGNTSTVGDGAGCDNDVIGGADEGDFADGNGTIGTEQTKRRRVEPALTVSLFGSEIQDVTHTTKANGVPLTPASADTALQFALKTALGGDISGEEVLQVSSSEL